MDVTIRKARAEDAVAIAPLAYSSAPEVFDFIFSFDTDVPAPDFLEFALHESGGEFGHGTRYVAEIEGRVVGCASCYTSEDLKKHLNATLEAVVSCYGAVTAAAVIQRGNQMARVLPPPTEIHYIDQVGVDPAFRGTGIGGRLLRHVLDVGRQTDYDTAALDVSMENPRAQALYERLGFVVTEEFPSDLENAAARVPGFRRMEIAL